MSKLKKTRQTSEEWQKLIRKQEVSGDSVAEFCRKKGLKDANFYARRRYIHKYSNTSKGFREIFPPPISSVGLLKIIGSNGTILEIPSDAPDRIINAAMQAVCCR